MLTCAAEIIKSSVHGLMGAQTLQYACMWLLATPLASATGIVSYHFLKKVVTVAVANLYSNAAQLVQPYCYTPFPLLDQV